MRSQRGSLEALLRAPYINSLRDTFVQVSLYSGAIVLPGSGEHYRFGRPPEPLDAQRYEPAPEEHVRWCWRASDGQLIESGRLAEIAVNRFLEQVGS